MVMGPAGTGKSTYCKVMQEHCQNARRTVHVVNLDPAAEAFEYEVAFDIRGKAFYHEKFYKIDYSQSSLDIPRLRT